MNFFLSYLASSLASGGSESTFYLSTLQTLNGQTISTADFAAFGRGTLTIDPLSQTNIESATFTAVDNTNIALTGCVRNMAPNGNDVLSSTAPYHPVGTLVIISFGVHNLSDLKDYIANAISGASGSASDTVAGSLKISENLGSAPRAMATLVSSQIIPDMTLHVNPFAINTLTNTVNYTGGDTSTMTAPTINPRIDLVVYSTSGSALAIRTGTEAASPAEPTPTSGDIVLCSVYHRLGETTLLERNTSPFTQGYIKRWYQPNIYRTDLATATKIKFGGTGVDGALNISSGTTTIPLGGVSVFIKNYTSISITGTANLVFTNPAATGTYIILKNQGDTTITSSAAAAISTVGMGANPGVAGFAAVGSMTVPSGATASTGITPTTFVSKLIPKAIPFVVGGGGINGNTGTWVGASGGIATNGGAALYIETAGAWNFTGTIVTSGNVGGNSSGSNNSSSGQSAPSGASGGGAGSFTSLYGSLTLDTGTVTVTGGAPGNSSSLVGSGGQSQGQSGVGGGGSYSAGVAGVAGTNNGSGSSGGQSGTGGAAFSLRALNTEFT